MELAEFYRAVLPPEGDYALFIGGNGGRHTWSPTIDELVNATNKRIDEQSIYFATGSYFGKKRAQANVVGKKCFYLDIDAGEQKYATNPKTAWPTVADAAAALVAFSRTFLKPSIIIASGGGLHVYWCLNEVLDGASWTDTAQRFKRAVDAAGLKADPTVIADSARVLRPPGTLHKSGARVTVLRFDPDAVYSARQFDDAVAPLVPAKADFAGQIASALPNVQYTVDYDASINDDFKTYEPIPTSAVAILPHCGAMREVAESKGQVTEPQWRAAISIIKHCTEGAPLAHEWSKGHDGYDYYATQEKYDRYKAGPATCETFSAYSDACKTCPHWQKIKSPIVLGRVSAPEGATPTPAAAPAPAGDPDEIASVLQDEPSVATGVGTKDIGGSVADPTGGLAIPPAALGEKYRITYAGPNPCLEGQQVKFIKDPRTQEVLRTVIWIKFTQDIFWLTGWTEAGQHESETSNVSWTLLRRGKTQQFELPNEYSADRRALLRYLAGKTINPLNHETETVAMLQQFVTDQIRRVKDAASKPVVRDHLGFHMDGSGDLYCAQGEYVIYKDGTVRKATLGHGLENVKDAMMIESLPATTETSWGASAWPDVGIGARKQVEFYKKWWGVDGMEVAQLAMMLQLASPLLVFAADTDMQPGGQLPSAGLTVSLYSSESAKGKTSIQAAASYAFGDAGAIIRQGDRLGMTFNAQVATAAALGTLPFPMDEVTTNDKTQVGESINRIASGIEKTRSNKDGTVARAPLKWALISTVSTNVPQRELVAEFQKGSDALQMRLIELNCDRLPTRRLDIVPEYDAALREAMAGTKGSLGALIHLYCCMKGYTFMRQMVLAKTNYVAKLTPGESKERFILRGVAAMLVLQDVLTELSLVMFDTKTLEKEVLAAFNSARSYSLNHQKDTSTVFMRMVRELAPNILVTAEDLPTDDSIQPWENERFCRPPYAGRLCRKSQTLYLAEDSCRAWAVEQQLSPSAVIDEARKEKLIVDFAPGKDVGQLVISKGIRGVFLPKQRVWRVNAATLKLPEIVGDGKVTPIHRASAEPAENGVAPGTVAG